MTAAAPMILNSNFALHVDNIGSLTASTREVLDFALFLQTQQVQRQPEPNARPVQKLEELYGDFWPEDELVDDFISAVQQWRREDIELHTDLR